MKLDWRMTTDAAEAYSSGRLVFSVTKERTGWKLYRYSQRMNGEIVFKSKEGVRSKRDGIAYANNLAALCK